MIKAWRSTTLGEISELITKGTTPTSVGFKFLIEGINFVKVETLTKDGNFIKDKLAHIDDVCHEALKRSQLKTGDILFSIAGALGRTAMVIPTILPANTNQALAIIRLKPSTKVLPKFVMVALSSGMLVEQIEKQRGGVAQQNLSLTQIKNFEIPLPPLPEQKRIVAILDKAFEGISQAVANAEKNLANARELFESYLNGVFAENGNGWATKKLSEILNIQPRNGWSPPAKNHSDFGTPVLTLSSVTGFEFDKTKTKYTSASTSKDAHYWVNNGDLLISRSNTPILVGHVAVCSGIEKSTIYPDLIMRMKVHSKIANTRFVYYQLRSPKLREIITDSAKGANPTMKKINKKTVQELPVSLPSLSRQNEITDKLDSVLRQTQHLETVYQRKLTALEELKQSILHKAFSGELTAEDDKLMEEAAA